jgi:hypothetical protein
LTFRRSDRSKDAPESSVQRRFGADTLNKKHFLSKVPGGNRRSELFEGMGRNSQEHFLALRDSGVFSAVTAFRGDGAERRIIYNDAHTPERTASDLAHELSHAMLEHSARQPLDALTGCRFVHRDHEEQAAYLSGALLITERGAIQAVSNGTALAVMAKHLGVSVEMLQYRINMTGARRRIARA